MRILKLTIFGIAALLLLGMVTYWHTGNVDTIWGYRYAVEKDLGHLLPPGLHVIHYRRCFSEYSSAQWTYTVLEGDKESYLDLMKELGFKKMRVDCLSSWESACPDRVRWWTPAYRQCPDGYEGYVAPYDIGAKYQGGRVYIVAGY